MNQLNNEQLAGYSEEFIELLRLRPETPDEIWSRMLIIINEYKSKTDKRREILNIIKKENTMGMYRPEFGRITAFCWLAAEKAIQTNNTECIEYGCIAAIFRDYPPMQDYGLAILLLIDASIRLGQSEQFVRETLNKYMAEERKQLTNWLAVLQEKGHLPPKLDDWGVKPEGEGPTFRYLATKLEPGT